MQTWDVIVLGAGASGMAAAVSAAECGDRVVILEAQSKAGRKILASGNGRCNLMNLGKPRYYGDASFASDVLERCTPGEIVSFWERYGLKLRMTEEQRMYPCTMQASTVMNILNLAAEKNLVRFQFQQKAQDIIPYSGRFIVEAFSGEQYTGKRVVIATGSPAQPKLGGSFDSELLMKNLSHEVVPFSPALTPLVAEPRSVSGLSGIRARCLIRVMKDGSEIHRETGEVLFTAEGISGICVMQCARFIVPGESVCCLNLVHDLYPDSETLFRDLLRRREFLPDSDPVSLIQGLCVPHLAFAVCKQAGLSLRNEKNRDLRDSQIRAVADSLMSYKIPIIGRKGFDHAQVASGGVKCSQVDPSTMSSRILRGIHITGEALNVDGDCGGFNLMFAWATGILAGRNGRRIRC